MSHRRQGNRLKQRIGLTAQLVIGEDDDLIQWWENIEPGTGNTALKTLLRAALNMPIPQPDADTAAALEQLTADTAAAFNQVSEALDGERQRRADLEAELERIAAVTAQLPTIVKKLTPTPAPSAPAIDSAEISGMKEQIAALMTWANEVHTLLQQGTPTDRQQEQPAPEVNTDPAPTVENGLTEAEQAERAKRLRRSKW